MVSPVYPSLPMLLSIMRVHGNLTPWYHQYTLSLPMLLIIMRVHGNLTPSYHQYTLLSLRCFSIMRVHGNLTPWYHQCNPLSLYAVEHHAGSRKSNPMVSPVYSSLSVSPLMTIVWLHLILILWDTVTKGTASGYPLITLLQIDIHSPRNCLLSYRDFCVLSFRTVGMKLDSNCCPYLLSSTVSAPRTRCLGSMSLALLDHLSHDRLIPSGEKFTGSWQLTVALPHRRAGWPQPQLSLSRLPHWKEALRRVPRLNCPPNPRASVGGPCRHTAAKDVPKGED